MAGERPQPGLPKMWDLGPLGPVYEGYREGAFLMSVDPEDLPDNKPAAEEPTAGTGPRLAWFEADPRGVIRLDPPGLRVPRRLARTARSGRFTITSDEAFGRVIRACGDPRREGGWIDPQIVAIFEAFHDAGLAHSVEAWVAADTSSGEPVLDDPARGRRLVGGLYGLCVGGVFCAESKFSRPDLGGRDASKVCLAVTIEHCRKRGFSLIDTQMWSEHLSQFGCERVSRDAYAEALARVRDAQVEWGRLETRPAGLS